MCFVPVADSKDMVPSAMCFVLLNIGGVCCIARPFSPCHQQRTALPVGDSWNAPLETCASTTLIFEGAWTSVAAARSLQEMKLQEACVFATWAPAIFFFVQEHVVSDKSSLVAELPAVDVGTVDAGDVSVRLMSRDGTTSVGPAAYTFQADTELDAEICSICLRPTDIRGRPLKHPRRSWTNHN